MNGGIRLNREKSRNRSRPVSPLASKGSCWHFGALKGAAGNRHAIKASHTKGSKLFIVGVDSVKARLLSSLVHGRSFRFSNTLAPVWFEQLASEKRILKYSRGQPVRMFERIMGRRAEALDCVVYALAVRNLVKVDLDWRSNELRGVANAAATPTVFRSEWMQRGRE